MTVDSSLSTTKIKSKPKYILSAILSVMLIVGLVATYWLTQQSQDIRQQALEPDYLRCGSNGRCPDGLECNKSRWICVDTSPCNSCEGEEVCSCVAYGNCSCVVPPDNQEPCLLTICPPQYECINDKCIYVKPPNDDPDPSNPPSSPVPSPSPTPTPPVGPQCLDITMDNPDAEIGDQTTFTCGEVAGTDHYIFRIMTPDGIISDLTTTSRISEPYLIDQSGSYFAQCQICTGADETSCHAWEPLP